MIYVVDASVAIKWYIPEIHEDKADLLKNKEHIFYAPELILGEFGSIVWKYVKAKNLAEAHGERVMEKFANSHIRLHTHSSLIAVAYDGAIKTGETVYDWLYLALAMKINTQLITADKKFYQILKSTPFKKHLLWIEDVV